MGRTATLLGVLLLLTIVLSVPTYIVEGKPKEAKPEEGKPVASTHADSRKPKEAKPEEARTPITCEARFTEIEVNQGGTSTLTLTVTAHDGNEVPYQSKIVGSGDARGWITLSSNQLTLSEGESQDVTVTVSVPADTVPGTYNVLIKFAPPPGSQGSPEGDGCHLTIRVGGSTPPTIVEDITPPTTTLTLFGTEGDKGWFVSDVIVNLTAVDNEGGSGVKEIHYILNGEWIIPGHTTEFTISEEGIHTLTYWAVDNAGNAEEPKTAEIKIDKTPPSLSKELSGTEGDNGWWISDVKVILTATDEVSGVSSIEYSFDGVNWITYSEPFNINYEGTTTLYHRATDNAGNTYELPCQQIKIDKTPPEVTITTPYNGAQYILDEPVYAEWSAEDPVSGICSLVATVENGMPIDTSTVGPKDFTVTAGNCAGLSTTVTVTYNVIYNFKVTKDGGTHRLGSAVEIMWQYTNYEGTPVDSSGANPKVEVVMPNGVVITPEPPGNAPLLQYHIETRTWHLNWNTNKDWIEGEYVVRICSEQTGQNNEVRVTLVSQGQGQQ
ncbi:MAG: hypothetical protein QXS42_02240 [Zestosphaera sp.]